MHRRDDPTIGLDLTIPEWQGIAGGLGKQVRKWMKYQREAKDRDQADYRADNWQRLQRLQAHLESATFGKPVDARMSVQLKLATLALIIQAMPAGPLGKMMCELASRLAHPPKEEPGKVDPEDLKAVKVELAAMDAEDAA